MLGHKKEVCDKKKFKTLKGNEGEVDKQFDSDEVEQIVKYLMTLPSVKFAVFKMEIKHENANSQKIEQLLEKIVGKGTNNKTSQLIKPKNPPIWTGQSFD